MSSQGPNYPSSVVDDASVGTVAWSNPSNAEVQDGVCATYSTHGQSHYLKAVNLGFSIPLGARVLGVIVEAGGFTSYGGAATTIANVRLVIGGVISGSVRNNPTPWTGVNTAYQCGGSSDIWGLTSLTSSDVNDAGFGAAVSMSNSAFINTVSVDYIRVTVYYELSKTMTASQSQTVSVGKQVRKSQRLTSMASLQLARTVSKREAVTQHASAKVAKKVDKPETTSVSMTAGLLAAGHAKTLSAGVTQSPSVSRNRGHGRLMVVTSHQSVSVARRVSKPITVFVHETPIMLRRHGIVLSVTLVMNGNETGLYPSDVLYPSDSLYPSDIKEIFLMTRRILAKRLSASQSMIVSVVRSPSHTIARTMSASLVQDAQVYGCVNTPLTGAVELIGGVDLSPALSETRE